MIADSIDGPSIVLRDVSLAYGHNILLENIAGVLKKGRWHGVLGPNGGDKSSLLKTILGLQSHTGAVEIHWPHKQTSGVNLKTVGYVPQLLPFDISLPISARDYLLMSLRRKPLWFKRRLSREIINALSVVNLDNKLERKLGDLSGGERQRLLFVCTLLRQPQLLILDEPMTGLDQQGKECVLKLLSQFHQAGSTIIMVEHDLQIIHDYCDQAYCVDKTMVEMDKASLLLTRHAV